MGIDKKKIGFTRKAKKKRQLIKQIKETHGDRLKLLSIEQDDQASLEIRVTILESMLRAYPELKDQICFIILSTPSILGHNS